MIDCAIIYVYNGYIVLYAVLSLTVICVAIPSPGPVCRGGGGELLARVAWQHSKRHQGSRSLATTHNKDAHFF